MEQNCLDDRAPDDDGAHPDGCAPSCLVPGQRTRFIGMIATAPISVTIPAPQSIST